MSEYPSVTTFTFVLFLDTGNVLEAVLFLSELSHFFRGVLKKINGYGHYHMPGSAIGPPG